MMLHSIVDFFNTTAFHMFGVGTTWAEIFGFITGLWCVYLVAVNNIWNFPIGLLNAGFFLILFLHAKLYADGYLQIMYLALNAWGWWVWLKLGPNHDKRPILSDTDDTNSTSFPFKAVVGWRVVALIVFTFVFTLFFRIHLKHVDDPYPTLDALTTGLSISAQILLSLKYIENWWFWIVADLFYIPLYFAKDLYLTGIVYIAFLGLSIAGLALWRKMRQTEKDTGTVIDPERPVNIVVL